MRATFLIFRRTSSTESSMNIAESGSLLDIFAWPDSASDEFYVCMHMWMNVCMAGSPCFRPLSMWWDMMTGLNRIFLSPAYSLRHTYIHLYIQLTSSILRYPNPTWPTCWLSAGPCRAGRCQLSGRTRPRTACRGRISARRASQSSPRDLYVCMYVGIYVWLNYEDVCTVCMETQALPYPWWCSIVWCEWRCWVWRCPSP